MAFSISGLTLTNGIQFSWPPAAPIIGSASLYGNTSANVSYTAVPGYNVVSHTAISSPGNITGTLSQATSGTITVNNLSSGTNYTFTVIATNAEGNSDPSASSNQISTPAIPPGQQAYTTAGTYTWVAPAGVTTVSAVVIGGGGSANAGGGYISGAGGGALAFKNNYTVTPGGSYTVVVGAGGAYNSGYGAAGGNSYFVSTSVCFAMGGPAAGGTRATYLGDGGGNGGLGTSTTTYSYGGNGGAGGYTGQGGDGGGTAHNAGYDGAGGGGGGGGIGPQYDWGMNGGGTGILGQGSNGLGGAASANGSPGSGGTTYSYGGGTGRNVQSQGAARLIWPGDTRSFPSTNTGDL